MFGLNILSVDSQTQHLILTKYRDRYNLYIQLNTHKTCFTSISIYISINRVYVSTRPFKVQSDQRVYYHSYQLYCYHYPTYIHCLQILYVFLNRTLFLPPFELR